MTNDRNQGVCGIVKTGENLDICVNTSRIGVVVCTDIPLAIKNAEALVQVEGGALERILKYNCPTLRCNRKRNGH